MTESNRQRLSEPGALLDTAAVGALVGALTAFPVMAITYLGHVAYDLPHPPFDLFDQIARLLPGGLITFGIDTMVALITRLPLGQTSDAAKAAEQTMATTAFVVLGAVAGAVVGWLLTDDGGAGRRLRAITAGRAGVGAGAVLFLLFAAIGAHLGFPPAGAVLSLLWLAVVFLAWGWTLERLTLQVPRPAAAAGSEGMDRRRFLVVVGGWLATVTLGALGVANLLGRRRSTPPGENEIAAAEGTSGPAASPAADVLAGRIEPAMGTRPEITSNTDFYRIDINTGIPQVDGEAWRLTVDGLVDAPLELSLDDLRGMASQTQMVTMECISNRVGGDLTGTSRWTGVRLMDVLERAGVQDNIAGVHIESVDGFYETVVLDDLRDERTLLVYAMNGLPLPPKHGFPLRVYVPNRFGMKQPKWIRRIEAVPEWQPGYWVERGWSREALVKTTSVVDTVAMGMMVGQDKFQPVGGIAWAGARGISKVEVQVDDGDWAEAELRTPPVGPLAWVQWRYDWPYAAGSHTFRVRAYDGDGNLQVTEVHGARPDGATGIHSVDVMV